MSEHEIDWIAVLWFGGWIVAVLALFATALRLPLQTRHDDWRGALYGVAVIAAGIGVAVLANLAAVLHDTHLDFTRESIYTPAASAMRAVAAVAQPVSITYFYRSQDPIGRRTSGLLQLMGRRNPLVTVATIDPDKEPALARTQGIRMYNAAVIEAEGRRVLVQSTDEAEIAIGIQRVLRERSINACFLEGHGELPMDNMEFHTHLEGLADHGHGEASSKVVDMPGHGAGRLRRALETQGYDTHKIVLATLPGVPEVCTLLIVASPRTTFLPAESMALRRYLQRGGAALLLFDLGFTPEPELARLLGEIGVDPEQQVVVDPLSHYQSDAENVAVGGYDPHPITRSMSMTFFPGIRPLSLVATAPEVSVTPLLVSSRDSYVRRAEPVEARAVQLAAQLDPKAEPRAADAATAPEARSRVLGVAAEGVLTGGVRPFRAVVVGDGDFVSNSYFPYMSNSDLALAMVRWLAREERTTAVAARIPVPPLVLLTAEDMRTIFVGLVILLPLAVITLGGIVWWRRR